MPWGFQYHPEVPYEYMLKLIKMRSSNMIDKQYFKNEVHRNVFVQYFYILKI